MKGNGIPTATMILDTLRRPHVLDGGQRADDGLPEFMDPIRALHRNNAEQWDREDDARQDPEDDAMVASAKRDIDRLNSARHGFIEAIDRAIYLAVSRSEGAPLVTESPGMAVDRLSVLVIRLASTEARAHSGAADASVYTERVPRLRSQLDALEDALATLLEDLAKGTRRFVAYESFKLYGLEDSGPVG